MIPTISRIRFQKLEGILKRKKIYREKRENKILFKIKDGRFIQRHCAFKCDEDILKMRPGLYRDSSRVSAAAAFQLGSLILLFHDFQTAFDAFDAVYISIFKTRRDDAMTHTREITFSYRLCYPVSQLYSRLLYVAWRTHALKTRETDTSIGA